MAERVTPVVSTKRTVSDCPGWYSAVTAMSELAFETALPFRVRICFKKELSNRFHFELGVTKS